MKKKYIITEKQLKNLYDRFETNEANAPWDEPQIYRRYSKGSELKKVDYDGSEYLYKDGEGNYIYYVDSDNTLAKELYDSGYLRQYGGEWEPDMIYRYDYYDIFDALGEYLNDYIMTNPNVFKQSSIDSFYYGKTDYIYITRETPKDVLEELIQSDSLKRLVRFI